MKIVSQHALISILVHDQDEALQFYTEKLGLEVRRDITFAPGLRLVTVAPKGQLKPELALARPDVAWHGEERVRQVMAHVGQGVVSIFATDNCRREYEQLLARGVRFTVAPTWHLYGLEAVFTDLYGNVFSLLEASSEVRSLPEMRHVDTAA
ncbi:MAG TPA: VOC family protein [Ktedonobacteraceae bacterium]|nr:VOC family protein [Ktedonobacteraceae bacterium]